ncbi:MAG: ATP synthase subunit I [Gammaproteobacteria bacterium]|nr:ATP synthase subunit I [Gammaproteobacteria bacterium]
MATKSLQAVIQGKAYRLVLWQLCGVLILAVGAFIIRGQHDAISVFAGGLSYGLPNLIFVWLVFRYVGAQQIYHFVAAFFIGEMLKMIFSALCFVLIVKYLPVSLLSVLIGLVGAMVSFWIVCVWQFSGPTMTTATEERVDGRG